LGVGHAFVETDLLPIFLWFLRIFCGGGPPFYAAEKPEKSASGLEIGRDVERDRSETKSPDDGCACFGAIS
jgi:hypothetical protein